MHSKMSVLQVWYMNSSRSTDDDNLIAQFFFEMIGAGAIKEALLQMKFAWLIFYYISLRLFLLHKKELSTGYSRRLVLSLKRN